MRINRKIMLCATVICCLLAFTGIVFASDQYPSKTIRIIVPYAAGGGTDTFGRNIAANLKSQLGVDVIVSNVVGGSGAIGRAEAAKAKADGYTMLMDDKAFISALHMGVGKITYKDMDPVCRLDEVAFALVVNAKSNIKTLKEYLEYAKNNPGAVTIGVSGIGGMAHLNAEAIKLYGNVKLTVVPFEGGAMSRTALAGGHVASIVAQLGEIDSFVKAGDFKILALTSESREKAFPDVPTFKESGVDFSLSQWRGIWVPKGTPVEVVTFLEKAIKKAMDSESFQDLSKKNFTTAKYLNHNGLAKELVKTDGDLKKVVDAAGLNPKK